VRFPQNSRDADSHHPLARPAGRRAANPPAKCSLPDQARRRWSRRKRPRPLGTLGSGCPYLVRSASMDVSANNSLEQCRRLLGRRRAAHGARAVVGGCRRGRSGGDGRRRGGGRGLADVEQIPLRVRRQGSRCGARRGSSVVSSGSVPLTAVEPRLQVWGRSQSSLGKPSISARRIQRRKRPVMVAAQLVGFKIYSQIYKFVRALSGVLPSPPR
jgi:hypothetical protein